MTPLGEVVRDAGAQGSNNWTVHGSRTDTGRPILASDPHRAHAVPSLRYIVHIASPDFDGIGAGEPALPGISIGHNGTAAFGLTLFYGHDQEDVYTYETHPDDPDLYRYGDGWERVRTVEEEVAVRGSATMRLTLRFTRHGPVIAEYPDRHLIVALRTVWIDPGTAPYFRGIASMRATSFTEFRTAMEGWGVPAVNQVYADSNGDIGWVVAGFSPVRPNWDGLLPVSGDGRYEWDGFVPGRDLPAQLNPENGYFATANEYNLPADWPPSRQIGYEWLEPSRAERIEDVLGTDDRHSLAAAQALQNDVLSIPARRIVRLLEDVSGRRPDETAGLDMLLSWDCRLDADSAAAALFEVWWSRHLRPTLFRRLVDSRAALALIGPGDIGSALARLKSLAKEDGEGFRALVLESLTDAFATCCELMGPEPAAWKWGGLHQALFKHAVAAVRPQDRGTLDVGPFPFYGSEAPPR